MLAKSVPICAAFKMKSSSTKLEFPLFLGYRLRDAVVVDLAFAAHLGSPDTASARAESSTNLSSIFLQETSGTSIVYERYDVAGDLVRLIVSLH